MTKDQQEQFNLVIGTLDRVISEMLHYVETYNLDGPNIQTMKHHAEDMIGSGNKIINIIIDKG